MDTERDALVDAVNLARQRVTDDRGNERAIGALATAELALAEYDADSLAGEAKDREDDARQATHDRYMGEG